MTCVQNGETQKDLVNSTDDSPPQSLPEHLPHGSIQRRNSPSWRVAVRPREMVAQTELRPPFAPQIPISQGGDTHGP